MSLVGTSGFTLRGVSAPHKLRPGTRLSEARVTLAVICAPDRLPQPQARPSQPEIGGHAAGLAGSLRASLLRRSTVD